MSGTTVVQANYDQLDAISQRLNQQVEVCTGVRQRIQHALAPLQQGGWEGRGAAAFFSEMDQSILPTLHRLEYALAEGRLVVNEIAALFQAAETEASHPFGDGIGGGAQPSSDTAGGTGSSQLLSSTPAEQQPTAPSTPFSHQYMDNMVGRTWKGEDKPLLGGAMRTLRAKNPSPADEKRALTIVAEQRGLDLADVQAQYQHYRELRNKAEVAGKEGIDELPGITATFMGSRGQLRFGQIVGDALGLDPVFGALLNPTGGMPGPGQWAVPANDSAIAYHSAFHDAAGFLQTHYDIGPGYDYLGQEGRSNHPFTGQESGLRYWNAKFLPQQLLNGTLGVDDVLVAAVSNGAGTVMGTAVDIRSFYTTVNNAVDNGINQTSNFLQSLMKW